MGRVRAVAAALILALAAAAGGQAPASAQTPTPPPSPGAGPEIEVPEAVPGEEVCRITDQRLQTLSGMVALDDGTYAVVNSDQEPWELWPIFILNDQCQVVDEIPFPSRTLRPEALAYDRESQILWVGDIGDDFEIRDVEPRPSVALWRVDLSGGDRTPLIHRLRYPDQPRDAAGLILDSDGTPIIVTHNVGEAELFRPAGEMIPELPHEDAVPLERVGGFTPPDTGTEHRHGRTARQLITGGANHPDGDRVVLRTYTDAFEFDLEGGDVAGAITEGTPRVTPLPGEPMGEAITYSADGEHFLTVSEVVEETGGELPAILRYTPTEPASEPPPATEEPAGEPAAAARSLLDRLGPQGIINLIGAVGLIGLLMVAAGIVGVVRARRRPPDDEEYDEEYLHEPDGGAYGGGAMHPGGSPVAARARVSPPPQQSGVYGAAAPAPAAPGAAAPPHGTVYAAGGGHHPAQRYDQPFDQDQPHGYPEADGYRDQRGHQAPAHPDGGGGGTYTGGTYTGGTYSGGTYQAAQDVPDYYYDDPDYSYEFRDRGDW